MKRLAFVASLFVFAACAPKSDDSKTTEAAATVAPAMTDSMSMDSTKTDSSAMKADSAAKKM
jgi:hypothetical protein